MLGIAFKEWAVICRALALGKQSIIIRKGGIAEEGGGFQVAEKKFWLLPTYTHQQEEGIKPQAVSLLREAESEKPPPGKLRLSHFAEVKGIYHLHDLVGALKIDDLHMWSRDTITKRYHYRQPGLFVLAVRVFAAADTFELDDRPEYAGCKTWVKLDRELSTANARPVLDDNDFRNVLRMLDDLLNPTAFA
ncbi:MAG: hypothetical protein KatS3mg105_3242 [Gemmatales bacterium]|nr:MAG: hypothetical protein KatS3mg105_3242 [Gemmatales bacterium]